jgi:hypothetical protein
MTIKYSSLLANPNNLTADQLRRASAVAGELVELGMSLADATAAAQMVVADVSQIVRRQHAA